MVTVGLTLAKQHPCPVGEYMLSLLYHRTHLSAHPPAPISVPLPKAAISRADRVNILRSEVSEMTTSMRLQPQPLALMQLLMAHIDPSLQRPQHPTPPYVTLSSVRLVFLDVF